MTGESIKHRFSKNQHQKIDIQSIASAVFLLGCTDKKSSS